MKKTILLVLVLSLCMVTDQTKADYTFGAPQNLGPPINTPSWEWTLLITPDNLQMCVNSDRPGGLGFFDIWRSTRENPDDPWGQLVNVQEINSQYNESFPCFSADGLTLYYSDWYTWNTAGDRPGGVGNHDLWMRTRPSTDDPWGTPVNMGSTVNSSGAEVAPTVSQDGKILVFASNRSGGRGDYDLWISIRPDVESDWGAPVNLGSTVNSSAYDGETWLSPNGLALFFSSSRPGGFGSYDLWLTTRQSQDAAWSPPVNLGPEINTSSGEGAPSVSPDMKTLYFNSDQPDGIGGPDMYQVPVVAILDFNGDGIVDAADMCIMIDHWGENYSLCDIGPTPFGDGIVDVQDLIAFSEHLFEEVNDPTLVAHWALDETEGDIAHDSAGDNIGYVTGGPIWQPDAGQVNGAIQLDGADDIIVAGAPLNPAAGPFSVLAWVKGGAPAQAIISEPGGPDWLSLDSRTGYLMTELTNSGRGATILMSQTTIADGGWHRIGFVWDGAIRTLLVDGVAVAQDTQSNLEGPANGFYIGTGKAMAPGTHFCGLIDDVRVYNRAVKP